MAATVNSGLRNRIDIAMNERTQPDTYQPVDTLLACLDLTGVDPFLIHYAGFMADILAVNRVTFLHVIQAYDLPDRGQHTFPDVDTELQDIVRKDMYHSVKANFTAKCHWDVATRVGRDDAAEEILTYINENSVGITMIGQKPGENRRARYGKKVSAEAASDILFVPKAAALNVDPVLCASDFSVEGGRAFERALDVSRSSGARLIPYFIADPTRAYFPITTSRSTQKYEENCRKTYDAFLKQYDMTPASFPCQIEAGDPMKSEAQTIYAAAKKRDAGLILVGAQGSTRTPTSHLGNLCESFQLMEKQIPVMIVKPA